MIALAGQNQIAIGVRRRDMNQASAITDMNIIPPLVVVATQLVYIAPFDLRHNVLVTLFPHEEPSHFLRIVIARWIACALLYHCKAGAALVEFALFFLL